jgi:hypothetical protein
MAFFQGADSGTPHIGLWGIRWRQDLQADRSRTSADETLLVIDRFRRGHAHTDRERAIEGRNCPLHPDLVKNAEGSTTVFFGATKPGGMNDGTRIQTVPGKS